MKPTLPKNWPDFWLVCIGGHPGDYEAVVFNKLNKCTLSRAKGPTEDVQQRVVDDMVRRDPSLN